MTMSIIIIFLSITCVLTCPFLLSLNIIDSKIYISFGLGKYFKVRFRIKKIKGKNIGESIMKHQDEYKKLVSKYLDYITLKRIAIDIEESKFLENPHTYLLWFIIIQFIKVRVRLLTNIVNESYRLKPFGCSIKIQIVMRFNIIEQLLFFMKHLKDIIYLIRITKIDKEVKIHA